MWHSKLTLCALNRQYDLAGLKDIIKSYVLGQATELLQNKYFNRSLQFACMFLKKFRAANDYLYISKGHPKVPLVKHNKWE